jgi:hypothetical protein
VIRRIQFLEIKPQMAGSSKQFAAVTLSVFDVLDAAVEVMWITVALS